VARIKTAAPGRVKKNSCTAGQLRRAGP
jgi:hypothetical protein